MTLSNLGVVFLVTLGVVALLAITVMEPVALRYAYHRARRIRKQLASALAGARRSRRGPH